MLVARSAPRLLSLVFVVSGICCYLVFLVEVAERQKITKRRSDSESRKIVAFSLLKQIEIESEEYNCDEKLSVGEETKSRKDKKQLWTNLEGSNIFIYSSYRDRRLYPYEYLRIIAMVKGDWNTTLFCQIFSSENQYYITKAKAIKIWSKSWNQNDSHVYLNPYLISCHVPLHTVPLKLSFNTKPCQKGNQNFQILPKDNPSFEKVPNSFTICVKPLNFHKDISDNLLQWIVLNRILGATKIELYIGNLPKATLEILESIKTIENGTSDISLYKHNHIESDSQLSKTTQVWQKRRYEIISYNDCLYRNIHKSHFVVPIDIDEIIVPRQVSTWPELLHVPLIVGEDNFASYTVRNAYYLRQFNVKKKFNERVYFFRNVIRSDFSGERESGKSFISTRNALTVFNHYALRTLRPGIGKIKFLKKELAQMNHYKDDCDTVLLPECAKYLSSPVRVVDNVIFKYKKRFHQDYKNLLMILNRT